MIRSNYCGKDKNDFLKERESCGVKIPEGYILCPSCWNKSTTKFDIPYKTLCSECNNNPVYGDCISNEICPHCEAAGLTGYIPVEENWLPHDDGVWEQLWAEEMGFTTFNGTLHDLFMEEWDIDKLRG